MTKHTTGDSLQSSFLCIFDYLVHWGNALYIIERHLAIHLFEKTKLAKVYGVLASHLPSMGCGHTM